jgi:hypothetical protein
MMTDTRRGRIVTIACGYPDADDLDHKPPSEAVS